MCRYREFSSIPNNCSTLDLVRVLLPMYWAGGCFVSWGFLCVVYCCIGKKCRQQCHTSVIPLSLEDDVFYKQPRTFRSSLLPPKSGRFQSKTWFLYVFMEFHLCSNPMDHHGYIHLKHKKIRHFKRQLKNRFGVPLNGPQRIPMRLWSCTIGWAPPHVRNTKFCPAPAQPFSEANKRSEMGWLQLEV